MHKYYNKKKEKFLSMTPLRLALKSLILELKYSVIALEERLL